MMEAPAVPTALFVSRTFPAPRRAWQQEMEAAATLASFAEASYRLPARKSADC